MKSTEQEDPILLTNIAGLFAGERTVELREGDLLGLVAEPENPYDSNAIRVNHPDGKKLGYIPRDKTGVIHEAVAAGGSPYAKVGGVGYARKSKTSNKPIPTDAHQIPQNVTVYVYPRYQSH